MFKPRTAYQNLDEKFITQYREGYKLYWKVDLANHSKKILIVYLSRTNNTKAVAEIIHENIGGALVALELEKPYPENYRAIVDKVAKENETGYLPPLKTRIDSMQNYDVVFIGFPTWGMRLPPPIKSFLKKYDLTGKTVVCGFPRSISGLQTLMATLDERKATGIRDIIGREATPVNDTSKYETGYRNLAKLGGRPTGGQIEKPTSGYGAFSPEIDRFLKEHLFADARCVCVFIAVRLFFLFLR